MNIIRANDKVESGKWARYNFNITTALGENGKRVTGSKEHIELSRKVAHEGMVLLENNGILPLKKKIKVALFGIGSIDYVKGGTGSGMVYSEYVRNIYEGFMLKSPNVSVYEPVTKFYYDYCVEKLKENANYGMFAEIEVPQKLIKDAAKQADVAIITIHRNSGEGSDRSSEKGDFYLTDTEQKMVNEVTAAFEHSVAVLDVGGMIDVSWIKENEKIDAALLAWQAGIEGGLAIADILCGDVNPSGKLTDTFAKEFADYPSAETFKESRDYVCYFEDIYVGYRYFETVPDAYKKVNYPFGYGLSYTDFEISKPIATLKDGKIEVAVTVKNIGNVSGKEVVQVYYSAPDGLLGKPKISLIGFKKTGLLEPNASEDIVTQFNISDMASYDDLGKLQKSAFLLEKGEYIFFAGNNCRNLTAADYRYTVTEDFIVTKQLKQRCAPNKLGKRMLSDGSFEQLPDFPIKDYSDLPAPVNTATRPNPDMIIKLEEVAKGNITLDEFLTQITDEQLIRLAGGVRNRGLANTLGFGDIYELGIPSLMTVDGPAGVRLDPKTGVATTAWPCATLIACTWDPELAYEIGKTGALECKENGLAIWLTPALNIHRNPLCGRNFEYFSEDPLIAGKFAAAKVRGIQSEKIVATPKHFACNNKETNRHFSDSRVSERALREIYLRGFEICVKEADPWAIMSSYNIINAVRCNANFELLSGILRGEWGYKGMVMTDWDAAGDHSDCIIAGNDLRMPYGKIEELTESLKSGRITRAHLEVCIKRILELILKLD